ncbi:B3/B4 domain-containing protein [Streptosporangium saharense]|uniref:B3/B4 domain-containing protein n=1 Tax=Streptosporangium saharense TaxID=1706840 RepID=UPI00368F072A
MYFQHSSDLWAEHPGLAAGVVLATGITPDVSVEEPIAEFGAVAGRRLAAGPEAEFPEIQAWRRTFSKMGLKPTQYRCASEALLRRFKKEGGLPRIHPLIDLCNAASLAFAIPVAVFDLANVSGGLEVRHATGEETYLTFSGETENPEPREVVFADAEGRAHARRWTNRQSGLSAVRPSTASVLIVAEALHDSAARDVEELITTLAGRLGEVWPVAPKTTMLSRSAPRLEF